MSRNKPKIITAGFDPQKLDEKISVGETNLDHGHSKSKGHGESNDDTPNAGMLWLAICFFGIMGSFVLYGITLEYATSGGRRLHELSLIFVTSALYTFTAYIGRMVRGEEPTTVPRQNLMVLAMTSMGSTFTSVRSLRYVIYPVQVLAKSCKPIPVMLMGALMGKKYPLKKYINVAIITLGVALFMGGGSSGVQGGSKGGASMVFGVIILFISLCFDGGTGAYEDQLMSKHHVGPFDLMFNIQLGKMVLSGFFLVLFNEVNYFMQMCRETGPILVILGLTGALGQVFIFVTISKFGALTCSIIGLARKVVTLIASIIIYGHDLNFVQSFGLLVSVGSMVYNFMDKKKGKGKGKEGNSKDGQNFSSQPLLSNNTSVQEGSTNTLEGTHLPNENSTTRDVEADIKS